LLVAEEDKAAIAEVSNLVAKVREMSSQRVMLTTQLREAVLKDDITSQLILADAEGGNIDVLFDKEISKHNPQVCELYLTLLPSTINKYFF
jgi:hypothetical protein